MRTTFAFAVLAAIGAQAVAQEVQPISQISDGQIQAPPATEVPVSSYATAIPSISLPIEASSIEVSSVEVSSIYASSEVPPVTPITTAPGAGPTAPYGGNNTVPLSSGSPSYPNSTVTGPSGSSQPTSGAGSTPSASAPPQGGGAAINMISFGGVAAAIAAFML